MTIKKVETIMLTNKEANAFEVVDDIISVIANESRDDQLVELANKISILISELYEYVEE